MIRKLTNEDQATCLQFLKQQPAENLFLIGDIEAFGMETDFQSLWAEFDSDGHYVAVLLKYYENYIPYAPADFHAAAFAKIMGDDQNFKAMSCLKEIAEKIEPYLPSYQVKREMYYAKCVAPTDKMQVHTQLVEKAIPDDAQALLTFLESIPEFGLAVSLPVEKKREDIESGFSRSTLIRENQFIVASASTTAENSASAMIVGVATLEDYKGKGYATACVSELCQELLSEGKEPCLFYDNPQAGSIYKRIGFKDIGFWMMYNY